MVPLFGSDRGLLVAPGLFRAPLTLARAQADGARSTALSSDDVTWREFGPDVPRFNGAAQRLMIGGQRTNSIRNPRGEFAVAPTFPQSTLPTNWTAVAGGATIDVVGVSVRGGIAGVDIRLSGTPSSTASVIYFEGPSSVAALPSQAWVGSFPVALVAGDLTNISAVRCSVVARNGGGSAISSNHTVFTPTSTVTRPSSVFLSTPVNTAFMQSGLWLVTTSGLAIDATFWVGWPQLEQAAFASSPILPAIGTPIASTRGSDLISAALSSVRLGVNGAGTILGIAMLPQLAPASDDQTILTIGTNNSNRYRMRNMAGGGTVTAGRTTGGFDADSASLATITAGVPFRFGVTIDAAGRIAGCINGGAVQAATGGPTTALTTLRLGNNITNTAALFGEVGLLITRPDIVPDADLPSVVSNL
jgi:hypothetical protein